MSILPKSFYLHPDPVFIAWQLIGKCLLTHFEGAEKTGGIIIETEAYAGITDRACHAYGNRRTKRTEVMYREGGISYIYLCYGMHQMLNIVTNTAGTPHAILIRAIDPIEGIKTMLQRRNKRSLDKTLATGPGNVCKALGIEKKHNGMQLTQPPLWIEDRGIEVSNRDILCSPRIGVDYAGEDALLPWRFYITKS